MDQFSHDLTVALEETSLLDRVRVNRWGQRRRTRSTGNLPCAPQPTEDSSSPTDVTQCHANTNCDGLDLNLANFALPSDSDDADEVTPRLPNKSLSTVKCLESDSLNETFSPARFFKPNARRKRKLKRITIENDTGTVVQNDLPIVEYVTATVGATSNTITSANTNTGTVRKRVLKPESKSSNPFFFGKRKRSNRDRYHDHLDQAKLHSSSMPRYTYGEEYQMRPRSFSSTSKPYSDRLLQPLNKGLLSKIEKISQQQKTEISTDITIDQDDFNLTSEKQEENDIASTAAIAYTPSLLQQSQQVIETSSASFHSHRMKKGSGSGVRNNGRRSQIQQLQFPIDKQHPMDCGEFKDFLSSSSLSSSESDDEHSTNDTDREGDDELTDWPGNELGSGPNDPIKRKLTKKSTLSQIKSDDNTIAEDDTIMSISGNEWPTQFDINEPLDVRYQPSQPITIVSKNFGICNSNNRDRYNNDLSIPLPQIESEMSGETTSNPFLPSPSQSVEVREIRAGCRRFKGGRPGFSIKTSVNERLARFLQDARQIQIRLPDIEIYEHESLINLATLYSLKMSLDNDCAILTKTSNTTQATQLDQHSLHSRLHLSDFKRRCYDGKDNRGNFIPRK